MGGLQGTFPHWKKRLPSNHYQQRLVLEAIVLIHNYWTELMGFNHISMVFDPETRSMSAFRTSMDTTGLLSITFVLGIMTATSNNDGDGNGMVSNIEN